MEPKCTFPSWKWIHIKFSSNIRISFAVWYCWKHFYSPHSCCIPSVCFSTHCDIEMRLWLWWICRVMAESHPSPCRLTGISLFSSSWGQSSWGGSEQHPGHTASHTRLPARCELHSFTRCHTLSCGLIYWLLERRQTWSLNLNGEKILYRFKILYASPENSIFNYLFRSKTVDY